MKQLILLICLCLFLVSTFLPGCKKKEPEHNYISGEFKRWTFFNKGSYWIYMNDISLKKDSVFIKSSPTILEIQSSNSNYNATYENIQITFTSDFYNSSKTYLKLNGKEYFEVFINSDYSFSAMGLLAGSSDNFSASDSSYNTYKLLSLDSIFYIGPQKFINVVNTECTEHLSSKKYIFWFAKDIGLIKLVGINTNPSFSWSLLRYHIVE